MTAAGMETVDIAIGGVTRIPHLGTVAARLPSGELICELRSACINRAERNAYGMPYRVKRHVPMAIFRHGDENGDYDDRDRVLRARRVEKAAGWQFGLPLRNGIVEYWPIIDGVEVDMELLADSPVERL